MVQGDPEEFVPEVREAVEVRTVDAGMTE